MSRKKRKSRQADEVLGTEEGTLLDLLDDVLNKGVLVDGELVLGVADVDLVYLRLSTILAAADRVLRDLEGPPPPALPPAKRRKKRER